jgi:hypothetical protein
VFEGIRSLPAAACSEPLTVVLLWLHESQRVFQDRLVSQADKSFVDALLQVRPHTPA